MRFNSTNRRIVWCSSSLATSLLLSLLLLVVVLLPSTRCFSPTPFTIPTPTKQHRFTTNSKITKSIQLSQNRNRNNVDATTTTTTKLHVSQRMPSLTNNMELGCKKLSQTLTSSSISASTSTLSSIWKGTRSALRQSWWCFPMILVLFPFYCLLNGSHAQMPNWWSMNNLNHLHSSTIGHLVCTGFLFSNIFYFLSGLYLLNGIPLRNERRLTDEHEGEGEESGMYNTKTNHPILGWLLLCSGGMSLIYHAVQSLGPWLVAESLCFVDHGLAISSVCCFFDRCGMPSVRTLLIGISSLSLLAVGTDSVYPVIHSFWHVGSAAAAVLWASDGEERRKRYIVESLRQKRSITTVEGDIIVQ